MKKVVVVLPTYNEKENIQKMLDALLEQRAKIAEYDFCVLVVDDNSPDGTGNIVKQTAKKNPQVTLLSGNKEGLGRAYIRGFQYAIREMKADIVFEMDADFSHNPNDIPRLLAPFADGYTFVIGSRYVKGGSIPKEWPMVRVLNSKVGNILARWFGGMSSVNDCTGGFRAIDTQLIESIDVESLRVKGYAFQISLLNAALRKGAKVYEVPIHFSERVYGASKIRLKDIQEFVTTVFALRLQFLFSRQFYFRVGLVLLAVISVSILSALGYYMFTNDILSLAFIVIIVFFSLLMTAHGLFTLAWMYYAWADGSRSDQHKSPKVFSQPTHSFTALVPARFEENVIYDTVTSVASIDYPEELKETLVICREDDLGTIAEVNRAISDLKGKNVRLVQMNDLPINKPHSLNVGLKYAQNDVVAVFDAEDEPHRHIYQIINTVMLRDNADVVQSGVQLMNYRSNWYSLFNVLEYFFWFKSALHFFARIGIIPLGGNTVFFKRAHLNRVNGWDEKCLTEDADIGMRLSSSGSKISIVYDEEHVTQEETPPSFVSFIHQRTRWNQGFIQIFLKGVWKDLPTVRQRVLALYILLGPELQTFMFLSIPLTIFMIFFIKLPVIVVLFSFVPFYLLLLQLLTYNIGLYFFTRDYKQKYPFWMPLLTILTYYPFQLLLGYSALRAISRVVRKNLAWEKTTHINAHRLQASEQVTVVYALEKA
jgi:glycosyltransferase XagB